MEIARKSLWELFDFPPFGEYPRSPLLSPATERFFTQNAIQKLWRNLKVELFFLFVRKFHGHFVFFTSLTMKAIKKEDLLILILIVFNTVSRIDKPFFWQTRQSVVLPKIMYEWCFLTKENKVKQKSSVFLHWWFFFCNLYISRVPVVQLF